MACIQSLQLIQKRCPIPMEHLFLLNLILFAPLSLILQKSHPQWKQTPPTLDEVSWISHAPEGKDLPPDDALQLCFPLQGLHFYTKSRTDRRWQRERPYISHCNSFLLYVCVNLSLNLVTSEERSCLAFFNKNIDSSVMTPV